MSLQVKIKTDVSSELITAANAKYYVKQNYTAGTDATLVAEDAIFTRLIKVAREAAEQYCNASFAQKTLQAEFLKTPDDNVLTLPYPPVNSITKVERLDQEGTATELTLNSGYYSIGLNKEQIIINTAVSVPVIVPVIVTRDYHIRVEYVAGYETPADDVPEAVIEAMYKTILFNYRQRGDDPSVDSMISGILPAQAKALLKPYRNLLL